MKKNILLLLAISIGFTSFSQELSCADFKNGTFLVPATEVVPIDSQIIRNGNTQIEYGVNLSEEFQAKFGDKKIHAIVEWLDDCSYRLTYDETKMDLDEIHFLTNKYGGLITVLGTIEGRCINYTSTVHMDGVKIEINNKYCRVD